MKHLHPEHLTTEAMSCFALSYSAVDLELVSLDISRWLLMEGLFPVEHLQSLFRNKPKNLGGNIV